MADRLKSEFFGPSPTSRVLRPPPSSSTRRAEGEGSVRFSEKGRHHLAIVKRNSKRLDRLEQEPPARRPGRCRHLQHPRWCGRHRGDDARERRALSRRRHRGWGRAFRRERWGAPVCLFAGDQGRLNLVLDNLISQRSEVHASRRHVVRGAGALNKSLHNKHYST